jgi:lysophospholipase
MIKQLKFILLILLFVLFSCKPKFETLAKEENKFHLTTTEQLQDKNYSKRVEDFYNSGKEGTFLGKDSIPIYFKIFKQQNTDKAILISTGRTEATVKYKELIYDLFKNGFSVFIHDHRGQGQSGRMTEDHDMGFIDTFQYYVDDMKLFYDTYLKPKNYNKKYLLSHSMGGAIGMTYLEQYPSDFNAAAFSSPMLGLRPPSCAIIKVLTGEEPKYALGEGAYNENKSDFKGNTLTGSRIRFERMIDVYNEVPKARLGGATTQWVNKSCMQFDYIFNNIAKIKAPFILFSAENEQIVNPNAHQKFIDAANKLGKNVLAYSIENAQHELLIEKDEQRIETINKVLRFYSNY